MLDYDIFLKVFTSDLFLEIWTPANGVILDSIFYHSNWTSVTVFVLVLLQLSNLSLLHVRYKVLLLFRIEIDGFIPWDILKKTCKLDEIQDLSDRLSWRIIYHFSKFSVPPWLRLLRWKIRCSVLSSYMPYLLYKRFHSEYTHEGKW